MQWECVLFTGSIISEQGQCLIDSGDIGDGSGEIGARSGVNTEFAEVGVQRRQAFFRG
jgi:hypothetical protein